MSFPHKFAHLSMNEYCLVEQLCNHWSCSIQGNIPLPVLLTESPPSVIVCRPKNVPGTIPTAAAPKWRHKSKNFSLVKAWWDYKRETPRGHVSNLELESIRTFFKGFPNNVQLGWSYLQGFLDIRDMSVVAGFRGAIPRVHWILRSIFFQKASADGKTQPCAFIWKELVLILYTDTKNVSKYLYYTQTIGVMTKAELQCSSQSKPSHHHGPSLGRCRKPFLLTVKQGTGMGIRAPLLNVH